MDNSLPLTSDKFYTKNVQKNFQKNTVISPIKHVYI